MIKNITEYISTLSEKSPPAHLSVYLTALWYDAKGDWNTAHNLVDDLEDATAYRVHAYLHRKEGDTNNAAYWYRKANKITPSISLKEEWEELVTSLMEK